MTTYCKMTVSSSESLARSPMTNNPLADVSPNICQVYMCLWTLSNACHGVDGGHKGLLDDVLVADGLDHGPKAVGSAELAHEEVWL